MAFWTSKEDDEKVEQELAKDTGSKEFDKIFKEFGKDFKPKIIELVANEQELKRIELIRKHGTQVTSLKDLISIGFSLIHKVKLKDKTFYYLQLDISFPRTKQVINQVYYYEGG